jgi:RNA polymerase-interacting CarD/CdnL/TRCF family regulator
MDMNPGDYVVHPTFGVGVVVAIEEMKYTETGQSIFYRADFNQTTVWIPVHGQITQSIRLVTPKAELNRYRKVLKREAQLLADDFRTRQAELDTRINEGTFLSLCEIVRDLTARGWSKSLSSHDLNFLKKALHLLAQEWSISSGVSPEEAAQEIGSFIEDGRPDPGLPEKEISAQPVSGGNLTG